MQRMMTGGLALLALLVLPGAGIATAEQAAKDIGGEAAKDTSGEAAKDTSGEAAKDTSGEAAKDTSGEAAKEIAGAAPPVGQPKPPEPENYRTDEYRKPVPATLKGATVLTPEQASELWTKKAATFIDVYPRAPKPPNLPASTFWREPAHHSIDGAVWLANVGYGVLAPHVETYYKSHLERLSGGAKGKAMVFFCLRDCWMSWNAAKRALTYGYTNVMWYPDGTDAWQEIGLPVIDVKPEP